MPVRGDGKNRKTSTKSGEILAQFAGVSRDTIKEWRKKPGFPEDDFGETILWELCIWVLTRDGIIRSEENEQLSRFDRAELRKAEADAVMKEAKARQLLGQMLDKSAVLASLTSLFHAIRARLQAIPGEIAASLPPNIRQDLKRDIEYKIELALREMAAWSGPGGMKPPASTGKTSGDVPSTRKKSTPAAKRSRRV